MQSIEKLLERDNPGLETMKMQVEYDECFLSEDKSSQKVVKTRNKMVSTHKKLITEFVMEDSSDFQSLTTLYKLIFRFLLEFPPNGHPNDKVVEREVAAALESVFPRIGLKTFVQLSLEEKGVQLLELGRIVLGIRLFNKDQKKGGAGLAAMDEEAYEMVASLFADIENEISVFTDACDRYQAAIVQVHRARRKIDMEREIKEKEEEEKRKKMNELELKAAEEASMEAAKADVKQKYPGLPNESILKRWSDELANRRQYLNFLRALMEEAAVLKQKITQLYEGDY